ncbi:MAG: hypothetical protein CBB68_04230 [Rhodospirillaceae bacterium TMED8]|nr:hypothetical protein [Magnetovibrio sp.]OUT51545.1 MAG: hypothetical protein CBB68_04230 [Rhodospirillaceae bacterium TMED8]|tara:strand:+ start:846 stop:1607 length:762 start_codon:yes stop_codon:yes gene_type:complete
MKKTLFSACLVLLFSESAIADIKPLSFLNVSQLPIFTDEQDKASANVIAFIGGKGMKNAQGKSKNFLVTQRKYFTNSGLNFYLFPNWSKKERASYQLRNSQKRAGRVLNLVKEISKRNKLPTYLIGFSRGSVDSARFSKLFPNYIKGIILASGVYTNDSRKAEYFSMEQIIGPIANVAVLVVHHEKDECKVTPFYYSKKFYENLKATRKTFLSYSQGGASGRNCGPLHHHGFEDIQDIVAQDIAAWISADAAK